jgi:hypothetical protein
MYQPHEILGTLPFFYIPDKTRYLHYDNLGSIDTITDGQGNIDSPNTQIHESPLSCLGIGTSIKCDEAKLVL